MADIITYPENGITYDADDAAGYLATRQSGVYSADEDFAITAQGSLSVQVSAGHAWVHPTRWVGRSIIMEQSATVTLTKADSTRSRIDRIVLRYDAAAKKTSIKVLEGTPKSSGPVAPDISRTALLYDLCLAEIKRPAGSTEITSANIFDTRADENICGVMRDGVSAIPAAELLQRLREDIEYLEEKAAAVQNHPVGSIFQSTDSTSPASLYGGTWEQIASERVLMGASSTHKAGTTVDAGLPNITGTFRSRSGSPTGAFYQDSASSDLASGSYKDTATLHFDASRSNSIYGNSTTVQPAAYYVYIWRRVA